jgi:hypothetical protein
MRKPEKKISRKKKSQIPANILFFSISNKSKLTYHLHPFHHFADKSI